MRLLLILPICLGGCAPLGNLVNPPYEPVFIQIFDQAQASADWKKCQIAGANYKPDFAFGSAISRTLTGATSNTSLIPVSPLVPLYGAAGGALGAAGDGFDIMSAQHNNVARNCLRDFTHHDGSAIVADPRP